VPRPLLEAARAGPGGGLLHPAPLCALALLLLNDHLLKSTFPGLVTGKLSDLAGLAFFPLFLQGLGELSGRAPSRRALLVCVVATGAVFALVKTTAPGLDAYRYGLAALQWPFAALARLASGRVLPPLSPVLAVRDPTDLLALPCLWVAWTAGLSRLRKLGRA